MELQPQSALPPYNFGKLLESLGRQSEALPLYNQCLSLNAEYYPARYAVGVLCLQMGRLPEAMRHLKLAARQKPASVEVRLALGQVFARAQRPVDAEEQWREVLRLDPNNITAQAQLRELRVGLPGQ
jgi:tetratricopeptide (TPR) repeat protein